MNETHCEFLVFLWRLSSELKSQYVCVIICSEELERDVEFEVVGEAPDKAPPPQTNQEEVNSITNGNKDSAQPSTSSKGQQERKLFFFLSSHHSGADLVSS